MAKCKDIKASDIMGNITICVRITGLKVMGFRLFIVRQLLRLSAFVSGTGIEFEEEDEE